MPQERPRPCSCRATSPGKSGACTSSTFPSGSRTWWTWSAVRAANSSGSGAGLDHHQPEENHEGDIEQRAGGDRQRVVQVLAQFWADRAIAEGFGHLAALLV